MVFTCFVFEGKSFPRAALNDYQRRRIISIWTQSEKKATFTELEQVLARESERLPQEWASKEGARRTLSIH